MRRENSEYDTFEILSWIGAACIVIGSMVIGAFTVFQTQVAASHDKDQISARVDEMSGDLREIRNDVKELLKQGKRSR